jgi:hypothetical protein
MKFLVIAKPGPMPPPVELIRTAREWLEERRDDGTFECIYGYADGGGFSVSENDSHEELLEQLLEYPLSPFVNYEVHPLVDLDAGFDRLIPYAEKMSAMMEGQGA